MLTVFTSLACYLGALPGLVRTVVPVPRGGHLPLRAARLFLLCVSLEVLPRRLDGTTAGCQFILPPRACATPIRKSVCTHAGSGHSRVRRRLFGTCLGDPIPLAIPLRIEFLNIVISKTNSK